MTQQAPYNKFHRTGSNQPIQSPNASITSLKNQVDAYPNAANAQKLDTLKHLFQTIDTQATRINQLEMTDRRIQAQSEHAQSQRNIAAKFDEILQRRNQATNKLIDDLKSQNQQLCSKINSLQSQKRNVKAQIKLPSFLEKFNTQLKNKLGNEAEVSKLRLFISSLEGQKDKLSKQLIGVKQQYDNFCKNFKKGYQDLNTRYSNELNSKSELEKEIFRLKQSESKAQEDLRKAKKQLEENNSGSQLYFKYIKEILGLITVMEGPEKWTSFVNSLKPEDFSQENKRAKIKQAVKENSKKMVEVKARLQKAEDVRVSLQKQNRNQQAVLSQRASQLQLASKRVSQLEGRLSQETALKQSLSRQKDDLTRNKLKQQQDIRLLTDNGKKLKLAVESLEKERVENNLTINSQLSKISELQKSKQTHEKTIQKQAGEIKIQSSKISSLQSEIRKLTLEKETLNDKIKQLKKQLQEKTKLIQEKNAEIATLQNTVGEQSAEIRRLKEQTTVLKRRIEVLQEEVRKLKNDLSILEQKKKGLDRDMKRMSAELNENKYRIDGFETVLSKINTELVAQASHYYLGQGLNLRAVTFQKLKELDKEISTLLSSWRDSYNRAKFFNGSDIITRQNVGFIIDSLDEYMGCLPSESKLVYKYDPLNLVNFHNYFDRVQNLIAFIRLTNGTVIGGFTVYPIDPDRIQRPGKGFLFSVTGRKVYHIRSQPKLPVVSYDNYYFIFGNAEIRLKSQEKKVFSNFGIANSTFDNGTDPRTKFLNVFEVTNNELDIDTYEFYRMSFKA